MIRSPFLPALLLLGCAPDEVDVPYQGAARYALGAATLRVEGQRLLGPEGQILADRLYAPPARDDRFLCAADEGADGLGQLRCWDGDLRAVTLNVGGHPDRIALSGGFVAYVASSEGLPKVFVAPADGSAAPRMLTNVGLRHVPAKPPQGFVPPPLGDTLRFDGDWLRWESPEGPRAVEWR